MKLIIIGVNGGRDAAEQTFTHQAGVELILDAGSEHKSAGVGIHTLIQNIGAGGKAIL